MRDPARIPLILDQVKRIWEAMPELRLGQLLTVVGEISSVGKCDLFYLEDDELMKTLKELPG